VTTLASATAASDKGLVDESVWRHISASELAAGKRTPIITLQEAAWTRSAADLTACIEGAQLTEP
jgi:hypothetical protein